MAKLHSMEQLEQKLPNDFQQKTLHKPASQDVLLKLDSLLLNMDRLIRKMKETGNHVEKVKNYAYFHS